MTVTRKKLIEVALPLEAINTASVREKSIRHGHPSTLHLWWARRPLAAARAVIFSQMVDDPSTYVDTLRADPKLRKKAETELKKKHTLWEEAQALSEKVKGSGVQAPEPGPEPTLDDVLAEKERQRLFRIIEDLVLWKNTTNETVLQAAREEIWQSWRRTCLDNVDHPRAKELFDRHKLPAFHDPFAGGGALPLEAQRLGLEAHASDLNPVAVLINKAMIEIPPKFGRQPPVNAESRKDPGFIEREWNGAQGMAEDVRHYGKWMRDEADKRIGHLYPTVEVTTEMVAERPDLKKYLGRKLTVIAWLWARTVKSPNPAFANVDVPLVSTFMLSMKAGKEAYVEPIVESGGYRFTVRMGNPKNAAAARLGTTAGKRNAFKCLMSGVPVTYQHIRNEGQAGRMGSQLMAIVAEGDRERVFLNPMAEQEHTAKQATPEWKPDTDLPSNPRDYKTPNYGLTTFADLFTPRQLVALKTFSDLVSEVRDRVYRDALAASLPDVPNPRHGGRSNATAYADAVKVYSAFALDRVIERHTSVVIWDASPTKLQLANTFRRQAVQMTWDFAEGNPFCMSSGTWTPSIDWVARAMDFLPANSAGVACQADASSQNISQDRLVSTDPPYYDNIGYADLSDFFYVWLRRSLRVTFPDLFATLVVPKEEELVATPYRHGGKEQAEEFFLSGMTEAMHRLVEQSHPAFPVTIYYAFKQSETTSESGTASTGWETFLDAVIRSGFGISGTWPMRTELTSALKKNVAALASSIVLVCRERSATAPTATRREFHSALSSELPLALAHLQRGNIAPVDLAQAAIGPGMEIYTRFAKVIDAEGKPLSVREALALINQTLDEALAEQEGDFDADSRWAVTWFDQCGFDEGEYGVAETLSKAKATSVAGMEKAGILVSKGGKVRLLRPEELPADWDPTTDPRLTAWEVVHHLVRVLEAGGETGAAVLASKLGVKAELARELAYRLYTICERKKRAQEALSYNALVQSWPEIVRLAQTEKVQKVKQADAFETEE